MDITAREIEIIRLSTTRDEAIKDKFYLDADAFKGALQQLTDERDGIVRCYSCGRIDHRKKPKPTS